MKVKNIRIEELVEDMDLYPRTSVSGPHVTILVDAMQSGSTLPPIIVEAKGKRIIDGFHRLRAAKRLKLETIPCELRTYKSEAEMFADAVRLNASHGRPFAPYEKKRAVERLRRFGLADAKIVEVIKAPLERVVEITSRFAVTPEGEERALKQPHEGILAGETISQPQERANEHRDGMNPTYHAKQLAIALDSGLWKRTPGFVAAMNRLVEMWAKIQESKAATG